MPTLHPRSRAWIRSTASMQVVTLLCIPLALGWSMGCSDERTRTKENSSTCGAPLAPEAWPRSGYYASFEAVGEYFHVWITSPQGIAWIEEWLAGNPHAEPLGTPGGPIELDPTFNPGYSYRLAPGEVSFGEMWIEVCDARPCYVEEDPEAWYSNPGAWCPWAATVQAVWDCSNGTGSTCGSPVFRK